MRAAIYHEFNGPVGVEKVDEPVPSPHGVVIDVRACGVCRSDLSGWHGTDPDIVLPQIPGHELAGVIAAVGSNVARWQPGDRVTVPFSTGCGACPQCAAGNDQNCDDQFQPGFTGAGSFAELVAIPHADRNLVRLPDAVDFTAGALLGCRFGTAYRAIDQRADLHPDDPVVVFGAGGLGLAAIMIAASRGADVIAVDLNLAALSLAAQVGAHTVVDASSTDDVAGLIRDLTRGGAQLTLDCIGHPAVAADAVASLAKLGRHIQVGLLNDGPTPLPMNLVVGRELEIVGSHGIAAATYPRMLAEIASGRLDPGKLPTRAITLDGLADAWAEMDRGASVGVTVVTEF